MSSEKNLLEGDQEHRIFSGGLQNQVWKQTGTEVALDSRSRPTRTTLTVGITWPEAASGEEEVLPLLPSVCKAWDTCPSLSVLGQRKGRSVPLDFSVRIPVPEHCLGWVLEDCEWILDNLRHGVVTVKYMKNPQSFMKLKYNCINVTGGKIRISSHSGGFSNHNTVKGLHGEKVRKTRR